MVSRHLASADVTLAIFYSNIALRDHLVEEPFEQTNELWRSGEGAVAVSSGREIVIYAPGLQTVEVRLDLWESDPGNEHRGDRYRQSPVLTLEIPSGRLYVQSAPSTPHFFPHLLSSTGTGTYAVRVSRRSLHPDNQQGRHGSGATAEYAFDLWRTADIPQHWLEILGDEDDD